MIHMPEKPFDPVSAGLRMLWADSVCDGRSTVALKSSCVVLFAHTLKIHPIVFLEIPI